MNLKTKKGLLQLIKIIPYILIIFLLSSCINGNPPDFDEFIIKFSVEYNPNGAETGLEPIDNNDYISGDIVTVPGNPHGLKKENYSFTGWNVYPDGTGLNFTQGDLFAIGGSDVVLFARWSQNPTFSVTYNSNGADTGTIPDDTTMYEEGMHPIVAGNSGNLVKGGFNFIGWSTSPDTSLDYIPGDLFEMGTSNVILYAVWSKRPTYYITYMPPNDLDASGTVPLDNTAYETGQIASVYANTGNLRKIGYGFAGWNTQDDGKGNDYKPGDTITMGNEDIRLYVKWEKAYSVTYNANNPDSGNAPIDSAYYIKGAAVSVSGNTHNLSRERYNFAGWNTQADGSGVTYTPGETFYMGESDVILYAYWTPKPVYTVTYNDNGAADGTTPADSSTYLEGANVTVIDNTGSLVKTGYIFLGWNTQADGFGITYTPGETFTMGNADVILYAKWGGPGMLDTYFNYGGAGTNGDVYAMARQSDGKIIIAGSFTEYNGITRNRIARLNSNGALDNTFNPGNSISTDKVLDEDEELMISGVAIQNDGKIVIVGNFTSFNGTSRNKIARLNSNGDLDNSFNPGTGASGQDDVIGCVAIQPDGKIIAGGSFSTFNNEPVSNIVRLTNTGGIDMYFGADSIPIDQNDTVTHSFPNAAVSSIAIQADGKIVIGGSFTLCGSYSRSKLARFNSNGTFDAAFNPSLGAVAEIYSVAIQSDGKILAGGSGGYLRRFNSDGTLDMGFVYGSGADDDIYAIAFQSDGKILLCGLFESFSSIPCRYLIRLNSDGAVDPDFKTIDGPDNTVICMVVQTDGNILIGGAFTMYENAEKCGIARVLK